MEINQWQASLAYKILLQVYKDPKQAYLKNEEDFNAIVGLINELMTLRRGKEEKSKKKRKRLMIVDILSELMTIRKVYHDVLAEVNELKLKIEKAESARTISFQ